MTFFLSLLLILFLALSAFFSASETAFFSLSSTRVKLFKEEGGRGKRLAADLLASPRDLIVTIIMVNVSLNIAIQNIVANIFEERSTWLLSVGVPLLLTLVFGEFIPKSLGLAHNERLAPFVSPILYRLSLVLAPVRVFFTTATQFITQRLFFFFQKEPKISVEELLLALRTSKESGLLHPDEAELVHGYLELESSSAKELMTPREEILFYDISDPLAKLTALFVDEECSRIPVCDKNLDQVLGILSARLFFLKKPQIQKASDLFAFLKKPFYVPESTSAKALLSQMYERKEALALVVDEYGSTSGLVTLADLVEEVIGEIADRRGEKSLYTRSSDDVIIASGKLELSELEEIFGVTLVSRANMVTIGGWLTEQLGDIPKNGVKYMTDELLFHVLLADPTHIRRLYIRRLKPSR